MFDRAYQHVIIHTSLQDRSQLRPVDSLSHARTLMYKSHASTHNRPLPLSTLTGAAGHTINPHPSFSSTSCDAAAPTAPPLITRLSFGVPPPRALPWSRSGHQQISSRACYFGGPHFFAAIGLWEAATGRLGAATGDGHLRDAAALETVTSGMLEPVVFFAATSCNFCWNWCVLFPWIGVGGDFLLEPSSIFAGTSDMFSAMGGIFCWNWCFLRWNWCQR